MTERSADRHADRNPLPVRLGPLRPRLEAFVERNGGTLTGFVKDAVKEKLDREEGTD